MTKKVIKICCNEWSNASRDKRELAVYRSFGASILVVAKGSPENNYKVDNLDGFDILRLSTRPLGNSFPNSINRIVAIFIWAFIVRRLHPDIITGHDLSGVLIGYMSNVFRSDNKKAKLIYDSHEFEIGRNKRRNRLQILGITYLERFLIKRCAFSIMVNDTIANEVQRIHKLKWRPIVVRSAPENWLINPKVCQNIRQDIIKKLVGVSYILMFHGNLGPGNGIEILVHVLTQYKDIGLVLMGAQTSQDVIAAIKKSAKVYKVEERILFLPPVAVKNIWKYVGAADIEMMVGEPIAKSHYYALPNKLFESIQSLTPIIASNLPEMKKIIDKYGIGLTCNPGNLEEINACVERMRTDKEFYSQCKVNLKRAKQELCWEEEKKVLVNAYQKILVY